MHKKYASLLFIGIAAMYNIAIAQKKEDQDTITKLNDIVVYANKFPEKAVKIAQTISVIRDQNAVQLQPNTGDVLLNSGQVFVQKSQQGGSSPVIRGFEASRILLSVDGIRLNNAIYRAGHLQNVITIDNMVLDRVEIIYGPSSTLYGSDALGGAVNMITKDPVLSTSKKTLLSGSSTLRYASATDEQRANVQLNIGGSKWASLTAFTAGSFGDMTQGNNRNSAYPDFGKKNFIVEFNVDEFDIVKIEKGQKVIIRMDSYKNQTFEAKINFISPMMDKQTRSFRVEALFTEEPKVLYPNLTLEANIIIHEKKNALTIPSAYLQNESSVILENGSAQKVQIGLKDYSTVEILTGIDESTKIILPEE